MTTQSQNKDDNHGRVMEPVSEPWKGPQSMDEAAGYHQGFLAGVTAYAVAVGHSGLKSNNEILRKLFDEQGWKTIETYERLTGETV